jgi:NTE family protein
MSDTATPAGKARGPRRSVRRPTSTTWSSACWTRRSSTALGLLASDVFQRGRGGFAGALHALREPDMRLLGRLVGGDGSRRGDLLSYLFFDPAFMQASIELGRRDAAAVFTGRAVPWRIGP